jgi:inorganic pyrophosphatase
MKTVFTNSELVHTFNLQNQYEGKTPNGSLYFYNTKMYSYGSHYLLCEFLDGNTVLINDKGYSNTTLKHISLITEATRNRKQFFTTKTDTKIVLNDIKNYLNKLTRARKTKQHYLNQINSTFEMYFDFVDYTKQKTKLKKVKEHREILKLYKDFTENYDNLEQEIKKAQIKEQQRAKKAIKENLKKWRNSEINWFRNNTGKDYLRLLDSNTIETSQGVKIGKKEAQRLCNLIDHKKAIGQKVDDKYLITACNSILKAGCHTIDMQEINLIRESLNI